jgi:dipeptidyl-peptidase-4
MNIKNFRLEPKYVMLLMLLFLQIMVKAQRRPKIHWTADGYHYYSAKDSTILIVDMHDPERKTVFLGPEAFTPPGKRALMINQFFMADDGKKVLIFTNTKKVWRYNTRGDYWVYDLNAKTLKQLGKNRPASSLMFAKFSPDGSKVAYVSEHNIYVEDLATGTVKQLTFDGTQKLINGTFDWEYEEEFDNRDGFRWSPDGKQIAYWQIDASKVKTYAMLNTTDSIYPYVVPVEYPVSGEDPSSCKIAVVDIASGKINRMDVPGDAVQHYILNMEWVPNSNKIILQQMNRAQNESKIFVADAADGKSRLIYEEHDAAWVDIRSRWNYGDGAGWEWINGGKDFLWMSEKDGWRHLSKINKDGKETLLTKGNYDVISLELIDEKSGYVYFTASPDNATQKYLYRIKLSGGKAERVTPMNLPGTHFYRISPNGKVALHDFTNSYTPFQRETISLPDHQHIGGKVIAVNEQAKNKPEFFKVKTIDGVEMDGWMIKPTNFDPTKKYPVVFYVYGEPAAVTVEDIYYAVQNWEYVGSMADDGYVYISIDNRGTPAPKGREWRKSIYKNVGIISARDQAMGAREIMKWPFIDSTRTAVWGWSGGGSATLNLMFQYPEIYKTGIAIAAVGWQLTYDNIYQERYMGVPVDDASREIFIRGSPITYAKNLRGNLLYIHGTGDDNVHYNNAEMLINELVKYNKQFQLMSYPNRSHEINEGPGTSLHLRTLYTQYLKEHCPPGGR